MKFRLNSRDITFLIAGVIVGLLLLVLQSCAVAPVYQSGITVPGVIYYVDTGEYDTPVWTWEYDGVRCFGVEDGLSCVPLTDLK